MKPLSKSSLAAGLILAVSGTTDVAYGVEKFFISGNWTTCSQVFTQLQAQHPTEFPSGTFGTVIAEIVVEPLVANNYFEAPSGGSDGIVQEVDVFNLVGQAKFDWREVSSTTPPTPLLGFRAVSIKAGNGRTVYVLQPRRTADSNYSDLNTTQKITSVLFCNDSGGENTNTTGGPFCDRSAKQFQDLCAGAGNDAVVTIHIPGVPGAQECACPGVAQNVCNPARSCNPANPDDRDTPLIETVCCTVSESGGRFTVLDPPDAASSVNVLGSECGLYSSTTQSAGGGSGTVTGCKCTLPATACFSTVITPPRFVCDNDRSPCNLQ